MLCVCVCKKDLALNDFQGLIYHKKPTNYLWVKYNHYSFTILETI